MAWKWIQYEYPVEFVIDHTMIWASLSINCYVGYSINGTDWNYICGEADHSLDANGKLVEAVSQSEAETNFWETGISADGLLAKAEWPKMRQAKYVRLYFNTSCTIYEVKHWVTVVADSIIAGTIHCANGITIASAEDDSNAIKLDSTGLKGWGGGTQRLEITNSGTFWVGEDPASGSKFLYFDGTDVKIGRDTQLLGADAYNNSAIYWHSYFESGDAWGLYPGTANGSVTITLGGLTVDSHDEGTNSYAIFIRPNSILTPSFDNSRRFKTTIAIQYITDQEVGVTTGKYVPLTSRVERHFGFKILSGGAVWGTCADGTTESTVNLNTSLNEAVYYVVEAVLTPGVKVEFYIGGVLKGEITTNLPSGTTGANNWICFYSYSIVHATVKIFSGEIRLLETL